MGIQIALCVFFVSITYNIQCILWSVSIGWHDITSLLINFCKPWICLSLTKFDQSWQETWVAFPNLVMPLWAPWTIHYRPIMWQTYNDTQSCATEGRKVINRRHKMICSEEMVLFNFFHLFTHWQWISGNTPKQCDEYWHNVITILSSLLAKYWF